MTIPFFHEGVSGKIFADFEDTEEGKGFALSHGEDDEGRELPPAFVSSVWRNRKFQDSFSEMLKAQREAAAELNWD